MLFRSWRDPMLHDGRAAGGTFISRTTMAIEEHGPFGEGAASAAAFAALSESDKAALFRFLDSLGRNEFDYDGDEDVDVLMGPVSGTVQERLIASRQVIFSLETL